MPNPSLTIILDIDVETGLYFGNKNNYLENQNIFISGLTEKNDQVIKWEITKIE